MAVKTQHQIECDRMREASGNVEDSRRLVTLLYLLARDHVPLSGLEQAVDEASAAPMPIRFTNGWLAAWAQDAANRLENGQ